MWGIIFYKKLKIIIFFYKKVNMQKKNRSITLAQLPEMVQAFWNDVQNTPYHIFLLAGEMGAGKTTFVKTLCKHLNCSTEANSPTYSIVNEYVTFSGKTIFHADLYRLNHIHEAIDIGIEEYLNASNAYCFIEWANVIQPLLEQYSEGVLNITFEKNNEDNERYISYFI